MVGDLIKSIQKLHIFHAIDFVFVIDGPSSQDLILSISSITNLNGRILKLKENYGQEIATFAGLKQAEGDFVLTIDDDWEHTFEDIALLIESMDASKADLIYGYKQTKFNGRNLSKFLFSLPIKKIIAVASGDRQIFEITSLRLLNRFLTNKLKNVRPSNISLDSSLRSASRKTLHIKLPDEKYEHRATNYSRYSFLSRLKLGINILSVNGVLTGELLVRLTLFSFILFSFLTPLVFVFALAGGFDVPGYASQILLQLVTISIVLFVASILFQAIHGLSRLLIAEDLYQIVDTIVITENKK